MAYATASSYDIDKHQGLGFPFFTTFWPGQPKEDRPRNVPTLAHQELAVGMGCGDAEEVWRVAASAE